MKKYETIVIIDEKAVKDDGAAFLADFENVIKKDFGGVIVESEKVSDEKAAALSFEISQKIQTDMTYPGQVKVTVIRETRAINIAK